MTATKEESLYALISDDDSDTIVGSIGSLEKTPQRRHKMPRHNSSRSKPSTRETCMTWLRWGSIVGLHTIIIALLVSRTGTTTASSEEVETGGDINKLYPASQHKYVHLKSEEEIYMPNMTSDNDRMDVRRKWDLLMPLGSGSVSIPDYHKYPLLGEPIADDPARSGPLFEASWTHALHCLYYSVDSYHQLIVHGRTGDENPHHASHCFEYLRNSILCNLDMTLEGSYSAHREGGGQAHVCRDREQAIKWIEERRVDDAQDIIGP